MNSPDYDSKLRASMDKFKAHTKRLQEARHITKVCDVHPPPPIENEKKDRVKKKVVEGAAKCNARTLEGRQCPFSATCGLFCKKHFSMM